MNVALTDSQLGLLFAAAAVDVLLIVVLYVVRYGKKGAALPVRVLRPA
jgi:hypothetical protein